MDESLKQFIFDQLHRIHAAVYSGSINKATVTDALTQIRAHVEFDRWRQAFLALQQPAALDQPPAELPTAELPTAELPTAATEDA